MKLRSVISAILVLTLLSALASPALAAAPGQTALAVSTDFGTRFTDFFNSLFEKIKAFFAPVKYFFEVKKEALRFFKQTKKKFNNKTITF